MKPASRSKFRCYVQPEGDQWVAFCVDLSLGAQAENSADACARLQAQINTYLRDCAGIDRAHAPRLLSRRAPLPYVFRYYALRALDRLNGTARGATSWLAPGK